MSQADIDWTAALMGDIAAVAVATLMALVAIGSASFLFVRAVRSWSRNPRALDGVTRRVLWTTLLAAPVLEWPTWRNRRGKGQGHRSATSIATALGIFSLPVLLLAWGIGALVRRRSEPARGGPAARSRDTSAPYSRTSRKP